MGCGNACIEAITAIAKSTATLFQMQQATNRGTPLPFPTVRETAFLQDAYDGSEPGGCPSLSALTALVRDTGVSVKEIKAWFSAERRARGHTAPGDGRSNEPPASVEIRTQLPTSGLGPFPPPPPPPTRGTARPLLSRGEYVEEEEEMKVDVSPSWVHTPSDPTAPYAYAGRYPYTPDYPILDATPLYDRTDVESEAQGVRKST